ncbi:hypothetical protein [Variovorax sp. W2I14]|uniref:hypothetical protein n=1 Tax=Variovorax sp. W2I14 TaxID=3042290 RepID=UPI003D1E16AF
MAEFFNFLYDDEAKNPVERVKEAASGAAESVGQKASEAFESRTGRWATNAAKTGLVVGAAVGTFVLVVGLANGIVSSLTGKK